MADGYQGPATKAKFDVVKEGGGPGGYADWIPVLRDRPAEKPFFLWLASTDPHRPFPPQTARRTSLQEVVVPPYLPDCQEVRAELAKYCDAIERLDANVGKVLDELNRQGEAKNTVVIFLSDSGRPFPRCKNTLYDSGLHTPLWIRWPRTVHGGSRLQQPGEHVDLAPPSSSFPDAATLPECQGKSFAHCSPPQGQDPRLRLHGAQLARLPGLRGRDAQDRYSYVHNEVPDLPATPPAEVVRGTPPTRRCGGPAKNENSRRTNGLLFHPRPAEELYDLAHDPMN